MELDNMTFQSKQFYDSFSPDMRDAVKGVSMKYKDYLNIIHSHLTEIYGERADWGRCVDVYYKQHKELFCNSCDDIPELTIEEIMDLIQKEDNAIKDLDAKIQCLKEYQCKSSSNSEEYFNETKKCAQIVGIAPEFSGDEIFKYLIDRTDMSDNELCVLWDKFNNNLNLVTVIIQLISTLFVSGIALEFPCVGAVITQRRNHFYYRGENAVYGSSYPSLYRGRKNHLTQGEILIDIIRRDECWNFFDQFDVVKHWDIGAPNYLALSQHYGFRTQMIDITNDLKTALFFGCCKYVEGKWLPLDKSDIDEKNARNGTLDSRYALLYKAKAEIMDMHYFVSDDDWDNIIPIGYQPFMRCSQQRGFMLLPRNPQSYDLYQDDRFQKYKYRLTPEFCEWIYMEMDKGAKVYPNDDVPELEKYMALISRTRQFTESVVRLVSEEFQIDWNDINELLKNTKPGYSVCNRVDYIDEKELAEINRTYTVEKMMSKMDVTALYRPLIHVRSDFLVESD